MDNRKQDLNPGNLVGFIVAVLITLALLVVLVNPAYSQQPEQAYIALDVTPKMAAMTAEQRCSNCHALAPDAEKFAPPLVGLIGRKAGSYEGFAYSPKIASLDLIWTEQALDDWLAGTTFKTPNIRQRHVGIEHPQLRRAVVAYIASLK